MCQHRVHHYWKTNKVTWTGGKGPIDLHFTMTDDQQADMADQMGKYLSRIQALPDGPKEIKIDGYYQ